jgi:hypothetical protein
VVYDTYNRKTGTFSAFWGLSHPIAQLTFNYKSRLCSYAIGRRGNSMTVSDDLSSRDALLNLLAMALRSPPKPTRRSKPLCRPTRRRGPQSGRLLRPRAIGHQRPQQLGIFTSPPYSRMRASTLNCSRRWHKSQVIPRTSDLIHEVTGTFS